MAVHFAHLNRYRFPDGVIGVDLRGVNDPIDALASLAVALGEPLTSEEQGWPPHQIAQTRLAHLQCLILFDNLEHGGTLKQIRPGGRSAIGELRVPGEADLDLVRLFDLSLESLSEAERHAFACLSVCTTKGFGVRAAAAAIDRSDPMPLIGRLARLSLLDVDQSTVRFRFHAVVDDYARFQADRWGLAAAARARHAHAMANLLREKADMQGTDLLELLADQEDIRHGLEHFADIGHVDLALLQGLTRLVEQTALGAWHSSLLARLQERIDPESRTWLSAVLLLQQGKRNQALGRLEEARTAFETSLEINRAIKNQRGEAMVLNSLGGVLRDLGHLDEARTAFETSLEIFRSLKDQRSEAIVLNSLGWLHRELGDPKEALEFLSMRRRIDKVLVRPIPDFFKAELKNLRKWSRQLATSTHTLAEYHLAMGRKRASSQDWCGAMIHLQRNLALDRSGTEQCDRTEFLAHACFRAQRLPEAIDTYRSALKMGPLSPLSWANFGRALHRTGGDLNEAEAYLRKACELQPDNAWPRSWLGLLLAETGHMEEGERQARLALAGQEGHAVLLHNLAQVLARFPDDRRDKLQEALDTCTRANTAADFPFAWPEILAKELRQRLRATLTRQSLE